MSPIFLRIYKKLSKTVVNFLNSLVDFVSFTVKKSTKIIKNKLLNTLSLADIRKFKFKNIYKIYNIKNFSFPKIKTNYSKKHISYMLYIVFGVFFFTLIFLSIPIFYNYDKLEIAKNICNNKNIECIIKGNVNYSFYPTPRIKIKNIIIKDNLNKSKILITSEDLVIKIKIENLLNKKKQIYNTAEFNNFKINFDFKSLKKEKIFLNQVINFISLKFKGGEIILSDGGSHVGTLENVKINSQFRKDIKKIKLEGEFLSDKIYISYINKNSDNEPSSDFLLKMSDLNLSIKGNFLNSKKNPSNVEGNISIKKDKHKFSGIVKYEDSKITINKSNLRSPFLDGKLEGAINFLPYFNFNLDLSLKSLNFTKLYNYFLSLDDERKKKLFKISNKINGNLSFSSDKVYSSYNLVKSFESQIKLNNGNILIDQFLINLGKLGAADILGSINNEKKFSSFKYESNIFIDNEKKFISKFGIYNKKDLPPNLFVSGNFDIQNIKNSFYEILANKKFNENDINFIETEFNDFILSNGYQDLFKFSKFKEFIKSITSDIE